LPQIRYCIAEKIRIEAAREVLNAEDGTDVERFNGMVNDINGRCKSYKYYGNDLEIAQRDVEQRRGSLETQGKRRFPAKEGRAQEALTTRPTEAGAGNYADSYGVRESARQLRDGLSAEEYLTKMRGGLTAEEYLTKMRGGLSAEEYLTKMRGGLSAEEYLTKMRGGLAAEEYLTKMRGGLSAEEYLRRQGIGQ
jgi:hypothetical protein